MTDKQELFDYVDAHWPEIQADIEAMVAIDSVKDMSTASEEAPFGHGARAALAKVSHIADRLGMEVLPCDNYCAVADLQGMDDQEIAIVTHVDVVPAGPGWTSDPFKVVEREGYLLGRGVEDDKGPGIIGLWAAHWFVEQGIVPQHKIRFIFGSDEESGMEAVKKYVAENPQPDFMFTPDAEFPVICGEKGILQGSASFTLGDDTLISDIKGGVATNAVAGEAYALVKADIADLKPAEHVTLEQAGDGLVKIMATGVSGHASMPEGTRNAIRVLINYLFDNDLVSAGDKGWASFVKEILADSYGKTLGIDATEKFLGDLTCVGGMIGLSDGVCTQTIDIRYPTTVTFEELSDALSSKIEAFGGTFAVGHAEHAHLVDPDDSCVKALVDAYSEITGKPAKPIAIGGGTYAKRFDHSVAFGPVEIDKVKPEWAGSMHGPDEAISIADLKLALVIYIMSLQKLMDIEL